MLCSTYKPESSPDTPSRTNTMVKRSQWRFEYFHRRSVYNLPCQCDPLRDYANAEGKQATLGVAPMLCDLKNKSAEPRASGAAKTAPHGQPKWPCVILYEQVGSVLILLPDNDKKSSRSTITSFTDCFSPFSSACLLFIKVYKRIERSVDMTGA